MQHLLAWRLPQLSSMVNAARSRAGGCGKATTVGFISCGGLPRHGAFADDFYTPERQGTAERWSPKVGRTARSGRVEMDAKPGCVLAAEGQSASLANA